MTTFKVQCERIEQIWGGTIVYVLENDGNPLVELTVTTNDEDPTRFKLGERYELTVK